MSGTGVLNPDPPISWNVIEETDAYTSSVQGVTVDAVRMGRGVGPNRVLGVPGRRLAVTSSSVGFPMSTHSHISDGWAVATFCRRNPAGSRWCGKRLRRGGVMVYGPEAEHVATNQPGLEFTFVTTELDRLEEMADTLGVPLANPSRGAAVEIPPSPGSRRLADALDSFTRAAIGGSDLGRPGDDVLCSFIDVLGSMHSGNELGHERGMDSREIVHVCIEFAAELERIPSIAELCDVAHVSERRLRAAFHEEFDHPPSAYFRAWALDVAHRRLRSAGSTECSVTSIAADLGFDHLGRFAGHYRHLYGELPSATLREPGRP